MYCTECGTKSTGGKFCGTCGMPVPAGPADTQVSSWSPLGSRPAFSSDGAPPAPESVSALLDPISAPAGPADNQSVGQPAWPVQAATGPGPRLSMFAYPWDFGRDIGAAVLLIWSLTLPWNYSAKASSVVYVLLPALLALFALAVWPLSRILRAPDGSALRWPTLPIRVALCLPYAVVVLIAVIRDLTGSGSGLGSALQLGVLGVAIAVVPRESELTGANRELIAQRFRLACAAFGGLGAVSLVVSTLVAAPPSQWFATGNYFFLIFLPFLILLGLFIFIFGVTAIRIGSGHPAWQPSLIWMGVALAAAIVITPDGSVETSRNAFYGLWLFTLSAGLAATPLIGGRDGAKTEARFWALVVANAFRLIVIAASTLLLVYILVLVQVGQYGGTPQGELIWILISTVGTIAAAAIGSSQLRTDPRQGRTVALICVGVMALLRVVDLAVVGWSPVNGSGSAATLVLLAGTFGVIVFALLVPAPMRQLVGLTPLGASNAGPIAQGRATSAPVATQTTPPTSQQFPAPAPAATDWNTDLATTVMITNHRAVGATQRGPSLGKEPGGEPASAPDPQVWAAADPATSGQDLMSIAAGRPDLRPAVAANPSTYPALLDWLRALGDPNVDAALARRRL